MHKSAMTSAARVAAEIGFLVFGVLFILTGFALVRLGTNVVDSRRPFHVHRSNRSGRVTS